ncbi:hypothetical protein, partial [Novosphingobium umbonatum]|uniref:hypothetical protein n=1 Tax=Novosphingobium umbonatum TaxID=1908524 RepID=UPI001C7062F5
MEEEQSNEPRMGARRDGGAVVRVERRRNWSDEEKLDTSKNRVNLAWQVREGLSAAQGMPFCGVERTIIGRSGGLSG